MGPEEEFFHPEDGSATAVRLNRQTRGLLVVEPLDRVSGEPAGPEVKDFSYQGVMSGTLSKDLPVILQDRFSEKATGPEREGLSQRGGITGASRQETRSNRDGGAYDGGGTRSKHFRSQKDTTDLKPHGEARGDAAAVSTTRESSDAEDRVQTSMMGPPGEDRRRSRREIRPPERLM
jgi:hypothetical protein